MSNLCPSCREPLNYPSGDGCAAMTKHKETTMTDEDLIVRLREIDGWVISSPHVHLWAKRLVDDAVAEERDKLTKAMRIIDALVEDEGYIPKRVESDYLDLYKTLDESL